MMIGAAACKHVGMPIRHAMAIQEVAERTGCVIIFRAISVFGKGLQSTRLLEEGYAAKGFRIDTKSCDWGPMSGFVCVDPRLSKVAGDAQGVSENRHYTSEALSGARRKDALGGIDADFPAWVAGAMPIAISAERYRELTGAGLSGTTDADGIIKGVSTDKSGSVRLPWALIPAAICNATAYRGLCGNLPEGGYGLFIDHTAVGAFRQELPDQVRPPYVLDYEPIMGLVNPGSESYGYRACVTGDYDLFGVWPPVEKEDYFAYPSGPGWDVRVVDQYKRANPGDDKPHFQQHYKLGNITGRLKMVKVLLNTALIGASGYKGGNVVHHSDEVGNPSPGLKKTLEQSLPLLAIVPNPVRQADRFFSVGTLVTVTTESEFGALVKACIRGRIAPDLRPEWDKYRR